MNRAERRRQERAEKKAIKKAEKANEVIQFPSDKDKSFAFFYSSETLGEKDHWGEDIMITDIHGNMRKDDEIPEEEIDYDKINRKCLKFHKGMPSFIIPMNEYTVDRIAKETKSVRATREELLLWSEFWWDVDYFDQVWDSRRDEFLMRIDIDKLPPNNVEPYEDYKFKEEDGTPSDDLLLDLSIKQEELDEWVYMDNFGKQYQDELFYEDLIELDVKYTSKLFDAGKITEGDVIDITSSISPKDLTTYDPKQPSFYWHKHLQQLLLSRPKTEEEELKQWHKEENS